MSTVISSLLGDVRFGIRALWGSRGVTAFIVLSLGLSIGATTAVFTLVNALLLRPLPVNHPEQLRALTIPAVGDEFTTPLWEQLRDRTDLFSSSVAYASTDFNLATSGLVQHASGSWVNGGFFISLGVTPKWGRVLDARDDFRGCPLVAVVSSGFAQRQFGTAEKAVEKTLSLNAHLFEIVGVLDPSFIGMDVGHPTDVYAPICGQTITSGNAGILDLRERWYLNVIARPRAGASVTQFTLDLAKAAPTIFAATVPQSCGDNPQCWYLKNTLDSRPAAAGLSGLRDTYSRALTVLMILVVIVLAIACANVANLLVARASNRQREMAIRLAMGAGRGRLIQQLLTESVLLGASGAAVGILFALWASRLLIALLPSTGGRVSLSVPLDQHVMWFTVALAGCTGVLFGLLPAYLAARTDPQSAMRSTSQAVVRSRMGRRFGKALVVGQVALSMIIVTTAGLLVASFYRLVTTDLGFRPRGVLLMNVDFRRAQLGSGTALVTSETNLLSQVRTLPGVEGASLSVITPLSGIAWNSPVSVPGYSPHRMQDSLAYFNQVSDGFFATLGTPIRAGRDISSLDISEGKNVAVINESMANRMFGTSAPLGKTFKMGSGTRAGPDIEVVGVVGDTKYRSVDEAPVAVAYLPIGVGAPAIPFSNLELLTSQPLAPVVRNVSSLLGSSNPNVTFDVRSLSEQVAGTLARSRLLAAVSFIFGAIGLLLAMMGLYGTMSYDVSRRTGEVGLRMALGATNAGVVGMVVATAVRLVALGMIIGALATLLLNHVISSALYGVGRIDATALALAAIVLLCVGVGAALFPAMRAARLDPTDALRHE
ncbi:MAG TPA: ABC transporter permease [Gemmatimonadales bacterium]|nr:ABC transporter permease [Gemmatimonadales bacterium]